MKNDLTNFFKNKDILVTGGCGYIGSLLVKNLLKYDVKRVRSFDINETGQFNLQEETKSSKLRILMGDIRDKRRLEWAMKGVDIVFHAAALKHVPLCEYNPFEAVSTNVYGTQNLIEVARDEQVDRFLAISTDKAVNPINTMGATKLLSEKLVMNASLGDVKTLFSCVRFGNVIDSFGSVIPVFKTQISQGGPVTVTSKEMTRFFMSNQEAVNLIFKAASKMKGREIFILKMRSLRIINLAEVLIEELSQKYGYKPSDIKIKIVGIRPGEKLYELLITEEETQLVEDQGDMFVLRPRIAIPHVVTKETIREPLEPKEYVSKYANLLTKDEIRKILHKEKIV
jgi:UDP-N-acetylglucosamine 4,6-dehydratase